MKFIPHEYQSYCIRRMVEDPALGAFLEMGLSDGLGAVDYSKDRVDSTPDDGMINKYIQKESIKEKIQGLVKEDKQYTRAWEALTDDERRILTEFFQRGRRPAQVAVDTLCDVYGYERTKIYDMRRAALKRFKRLLVG